jgi:hypothetical protein
MSLALAPLFAKGIILTLCALILFVGSIYILLSAIFGLRMAYLVLAVSLFGWMIIFSLLWTVGQPSILGVTGTLPNLGPRGVEPHWQVFAATTNPVRTKYPQTATYPERPWHPPDKVSTPSVATVTSAIQTYMVQKASEPLEKQGITVCDETHLPGTGCFALDPTSFVVQDVEFATASDGTHLAAAHSFFTQGGPQVVVYTYHDTGNVNVYSRGFLAASVFFFLIHLPFLDRAEKKRKAILTGGTAPPWYGPA